MLWHLGTKTKGLAAAHDVVDPGLQRKWNRKVIHGCADHHEVSRGELSHESIGGGEGLLVRGRPLRRIRMSSFNPFVTDERKHSGGKVALNYLTCGMLFLPRFYELLGQLTGNGIAACAGINPKQFHGQILQEV